jgi:hypothetical protein
VSRARAAVLAVVAVLVLAAGVFEIVRLSSSAASAPPGTAPSTQVASAAPAIPRRGAYFGAWVRDGAFTQSNQILALKSLQDSVGRRLAIVHTYLTWQGVFPTQSDLAALDQGSMLLLSWTGAGSAGVAAGQDDSVIRERAEEIKATGKPIFLEWRWEMNRPNLRSVVGTPAQFIAAWKHVRAIFAEEQVDNVAWVWCPTAQGFDAGGNAAAYYPGNSEVDWICADVYPGPGPFTTFSNTAGPFLSWASRIHKPVMIGEFGVPERYGSQLRAQWLEGAARTARSLTQIKAMVYFDSDPTGAAPGDSMFLSYGTLPMREFQQIAEEPYFNPPGLPAPG